MLLGPANVLFYVFVGIPLARLPRAIAVLLPPAVYLVARAVKPYGREVERLEAEGKL